MIDISVTIGGRAYRLACEENEQSRLKALAIQLDEKVKMLQGDISRSSYDQLIVMAALTVLDESWDLKDQIKSFENDTQMTASSRSISMDLQKADGTPSKELTDKLQQAAGKLKAMASEMNKETKPEKAKIKKPVKLNLKPKKMGL